MDTSHTQIKQAVEGLDMFLRTYLKNNTGYIKTVLSWLNKITWNHGNLNNTYG